uniref:RNA-directed DNA polymerase n=1 Tax=Welwitschia mirabilis virus 1 TaxID=2919574 RepID=A0A9N6YK21_9VIRU|nr:TPA_asm: polyprotein [Welwitschia mirabilis virus 1]
MEESRVSQITPIHKMILENESWFDEETQKIRFPDTKKHDLYELNGFVDKYAKHIKQSEVHLNITGEGLRPVLLPFFDKEHIERWQKNGYKSVHLGQIDIIVSPRFNYNLNAEYVATLVDVRHIRWEDAKICQFKGILNKDGICSVQPNYQISLSDEHLAHSLMLCIEIHGINLLEGSTYAAIGSRCIFNLVSHTLANSRFPYGVRFPVGSRHLAEVGKSINTDGFEDNYPCMIDKLERIEFSKENPKKEWIPKTRPTSIMRRNADIRLKVLPGQSHQVNLVKAPNLNVEVEEGSSPNSKEPEKQSLIKPHIYGLRASYNPFETQSSFKPMTYWEAVNGLYTDDPFGDSPFTKKAKKETEFKFFDLEDTFNTLDGTYDDSDDETEQNEYFTSLEELDFAKGIANTELSQEEIEKNSKNDDIEILPENLVEKEMKKFEEWKNYAISWQGHDQQRREQLENDRNVYMMQSSQSSQSSTNYIQYGNRKYKWIPKGDIKIGEKELESQNKSVADVSHLISRNTSEKKSDEGIRQRNYLIASQDKTEAQIENIETQLDSISMSVENIEESIQGAESQGEKSNQVLLEIQKDVRAVIDHMLEEKRAKAQSTTITSIDKPKEKLRGLEKRYDKTFISPTSQMLSTMYSPMHESLEEQLRKMFQKETKESTEVEELKSQVQRIMKELAERKEITVSFEEKDVKGKQVLMVQKKDKHEMEQEFETQIPKNSQMGLMEKTTPQIPALNIDHLETHQIHFSFDKYFHELRVCLAYYGEQKEQNIIFTAIGRLSGILGYWWQSLPTEEQNGLLATNITTYQSRLLQEFGPAINEQSTLEEKLFLSQRKLEKPSKIKAYMAKYRNDVYRLALQDKSEIKMQFISSLSDGLAQKILEDLTNRNISIEQISWIDLIQFIEKCIRGICVHEKAKSVLPEITKTVCDTYDENRYWKKDKWQKRKKKRFKKRYPQYRYRIRKIPRIPKRKFRPYKYLKRRKFQKDSQCCWNCQEKGHYANKCPQRPPRHIKAFSTYQLAQDYQPLLSPTSSDNSVFSFSFSQGGVEDDDFSEFSEFSDDTEMSSQHESENEKPSKQIAQLAINMVKCQECEIQTKDTESEESDQEEEEEYQITPRRTDKKPMMKEQIEFENWWTEEQERRKKAEETQSKREEQETSTSKEMERKVIKEKNAIIEIIDRKPFSPFEIHEQQQILPIQKTGPVSADLFYAQMKETNTIIIPVFIKKQNKYQNYYGFIDTGANLNFCQYHVCQEYWDTLDNFGVNTMNGYRQIKYGAKNVPMLIGKSYIHLDFICLDDSEYEIGLGMTFLNKFMPIQYDRDKLLFTDPKSKNRFVIHRVIHKEKESPKVRMNSEEFFETEKRELLKACIQHPLEKWKDGNKLARIITKHDLAIQVPNLNLNSEDTEEITKQIRELESKNLIRKSESDYACPAFIVRNHAEIKRGKARMVINYKALNEVTYDFKWPMKNKEQLIEKAAKGKIFSKFDCKSGYHQIKIAEEDKHKTAFYTPIGLYEWNVMPFGLKNAPAMFQQKMDFLFQDYQYIINYIDDFLIVSDSLEEHKMHLQEFAKLCIEFGIGLSSDSKKFQIGRSEIEFLGITLRNGAIHMQDHIGKKILELQRPNTKVELQRILGLANYCRPYILHLSEILKPLSDLLKDKRISWTQEAEKAIIRLKEEVKDLPPLYPIFKGPFILYTDASRTTWSGVLIRKEEKIELVCKYVSGKFSEVEMKFDILMKEGLAIIKSLEKFSSVLIDQKFIIRTDSRAMTYILKKNWTKHPYLSRIMQWQYILSNFNYTIEHISGIRNILADMLTREFAYEIQDKHSRRVKHCYMMEGSSSQEGTSQARTVEEGYEGGLYNPIFYPETSFCQLTDIDRLRLHGYLSLSGWRLISSQPIGAVRENITTLPADFRMDQEIDKNEYFQLINENKEDITTISNWEHANEENYRGITSIELHLHNIQKVQSNYHQLFSWLRGEPFMVYKVYIHPTEQFILHPYTKAIPPPNYGNFIYWYGKFGCHPNHLSHECPIDLYRNILGSRNLTGLKETPFDAGYYAWTKRYNHPDRIPESHIAPYYLLTTLAKEDFLIGQDQVEYWFFNYYTADLDDIQERMRRNHLRNSNDPKSINVQKLKRFLKNSPANYARDATNIFQRWFDGSAISQDSHPFDRIEVTSDIIRAYTQEQIQEIRHSQNTVLASISPGSEAYRKIQGYPDNNYALSTRLFEIGHRDLFGEEDNGYNYWVYSEQAIDRATREYNFEGQMRQSLDPQRL